MSHAFIRCDRCLWWEKDEPIYDEIGAQIDEEGNPWVDPGRDDWPGGCFYDPPTRSTLSLSDLLSVVESYRRYMSDDELDKSIWWSNPPMFSGERCHHFQERTDKETA